IRRQRQMCIRDRDKARHYQHSEIGYNYRMSNIVAGIGRGQLKVLNNRITKKQNIHEFYKRELAELPQISFMPENDWSEANFWLSSILLDGVDPNYLMDELNSANIESRPIWKPMHLQPVFEKYDYIGGNVAQNLFKTGICLPSDTKMTDEDLYRVTNTIKRVLANEK
ncbi:DegT/DnrJ/EryC1/StrS family aminotransferase, partial [uncultured Enterococcus sp.]|uniref:DegT/DnrJ/EryC1/StrS family aminotransferase n=1 Tax=uncultured Enterococcus sp. TaxID=167972 RepID=UPI0028060570